MVVRIACIAMLPLKVLRRTFRGRAIVNSLAFRELPAMSAIFAASYEGPLTRRLPELSN